ncbi:MAG: TetR/AcrR family transcriptional regulator, partial [Acidimicrobiia bacterium]|nr:TetR/AcrR family transcriptional regulator [Acidimicrobiia bacterium]
MSDVRRKILDASIDLVAEQGVRAVSFREAARRAGVSHQAPYHHFGDHRGILAEIAREGFAALADAMTEAAAAQDDPLEGLAEAGVAYVEFATAHVGHFRVMFQQPADSDGSVASPEAERTQDVLVRLTAQAVHAGFGRGLAPDVLAPLCWSTVHGLATLLVERLLDAEPTLDEDGQDV